MIFSELLPFYSLFSTMKQLVFLLLIILPMTQLKTQPAEVLAAFQPGQFTSSTGHQLPYRVLWPVGYKQDTTHRYPMVLFLHGAGERGTDNQLQLTHGAALFLANQTAYPAIVVVPQCATEDYWAQMEKDTLGNRFFNFDEVPNPSLAAVTELLNQFLQTEQTDPERIYLMGLSMGGMGTFELLARQPQTFAAAVPICGGTNPALVPIYGTQVPLWIFHGTDDGVVEVIHSRRVVAALKRLGVATRYTEYPGVGHGSWDNAFAEPELLAWLFSHRRQQ